MQSIPLIQGRHDGQGPRYRPHHRLRQSGDAAHCQARARARRPLGDRAVQQGRGGAGTAEAQGRHSLRRSGLGDNDGLATRTAGDLRLGSADPVDLLRAAGDRRAARRRGRGRACGGVRPRGYRDQRDERAVRWRLGGRSALSGLDEPRRPRDPPARRLHGEGCQRECAVRDRDRRAPPHLHDHVSPRSGAHA